MAVREVIVQADGGSRGNPGPAGYGAVVLSLDGAVLDERAAALGISTNNVAEYSGLIAGLEAAKELGASRVTARLDSKLVVEQMSGRWKVKHPDMKPLANRAAALVAGFDRVDFEWVPRAQNAHADRLANEAMDAARDGTSWTGPSAEPPGEDPVAAAPAAVLPRPGTAGPTRIVVVRHGQTTWGAELRFAGRRDVPLTERGRRQATAVAKRVSALSPAVVLSSPLLRCADTAASIAGEVGAPVVTDERLIDGLLGDWTGFRADQIAAQWPGEFASWRSDPDAAPPGGESFTAIRERVEPVVRDATTRYPGAAVVLVTHAAPAKMILAAALGVDSTVAYRVRIDTASLSGFTVEEGGAVMVWAVNDTGHLVG